MTAETQVLIAFLLYLAFFGWIGLRRGWLSELIVMVVAVVGWIVLQERGTFFVRMANFAGKFMALIGAGGLSSDPAEALQAVQDAPAVVTEATTPGFLFLLWVLLVLLTYIITSQKPIAKHKEHKGLGLLFGLANGFVFASLLLPVLSTLFSSTDLTKVSEAPLENLVMLVSTIGKFLVESVRSFWQWIQPVNSLTWLLIITTLLVITALTLRKTAKAKS